MTRIKTGLILAISVILLAFSSCNLHAPLLEDLEIDINSISYIVLTNNDGESVTVKDSAGFSFLADYTKSGKLDEDREYEVHDTSNYTLCTITPIAGDGAAIYLFNSGEIVCRLGDGIDGAFYTYNTEGEKADTEFVKKMFEEYRFEE